MKTGSTAFQDLMKNNYSLLEQSGIRYHFLRNKHLLENLEAVLQDEEKRGWPRVLFLSSEFLCQAEPLHLKAALKSVPARAEAVLVARPLREIYPSLYLQNLKGPVMRTSSYEEFLKDQIDLDRRPEQSKGGERFRYQFLEEQMRTAGCAVHWVSYERSSLLKNLVSWLTYHADTTELSGKLKAPPKAKGLSPRRSLDGSVVDVARCLNTLCRAEKVSRDDREKLLTSLLDSSDRIRLQRKGPDPFIEKYAAWLDALDDELNGDFWVQRAIPQQP